MPALDGNVERVLCRITAFDGDPKRRSHRDTLLAHAAEFLDPRQPGESNQALMELGATVCLPRRPRCGSCPLAASCRGRSEGDPERYPPPRRKRATERVDWSVAVVEQQGRVLFFRRPQDSELMAGMWELPNVPHSKRRLAVEEALAARYGGSWKLENASFEVRHAVTYRSLTLHAHRARYTVGSRAEDREAAWISPAERSRYGVSSMFEKVLGKS